MIESGERSSTNIYGDNVDGDKVGGDKIAVGNISDSYTAIGAGAQVIVTQIQQALSAVDELDKSIQAAERRLAEAIRKKITDISKTTFMDVDNRGNPYKALLDYKLEDAPFFYGRSEAIAIMREKLAQSRLTILHSDSGSGKSSLLQAGLASRLLAEGQFPLYLRPYDQRPDQFIKKAFLPDYATQEDLWRYSDEQMTLKGFLERVTHYLGEQRLVIFLDQFEEFFTELSPEQQESFARQLRECVESDLSVWWVLALRKEYFSDLRLFATLKPFENEYFLPTFKLEEAQEVVVEPAVLKDVTYEDGLVDQILDDIRQDSAEIPPAQVQLVCYTLFDELPGNGDSAQITFDLYNQPRGRGAGAPGAEGILTSHLSRVLDRELKGQERKVASRVLEKLVTSDVRRVKSSREELQSALDPEQAALLAPVLSVLYANRLVRRELDENDQPVYELAHDYLLNEIELDPETQARKAAQELLVQEAHTYQQHDTLLSEDKYAIINTQREYLQFDDTAAELLEKSEAAIKAERQRELEQEQRLAEEQRLRAEEQRLRAEDAEQAASSLRKRLFLATGAVAVAILFLAAALWFGIDADNQRDIAATSAAVADAQRDAAATSAAVADDERREALAARSTALAEARRADDSAAIAINALLTVEAQLIDIGETLYGGPTDQIDTALVEEIIGVQSTAMALRAAQSPTRQTIQIGESVKGQSITVSRFGDGPKKLLFVGGIHSGLISRSVEMADLALDWFSENPDAIPPSLTIYVLPVLNPDSLTVTGEFEGVICKKAIQAIQNGKEVLSTNKKQTCSYHK